LLSERNVSDSLHAMRAYQDAHRLTNQTSANRNHTHARTRARIKNLTENGIKLAGIHDFNLLALIHAESQWLFWPDLLLEIRSCNEKYISKSYIHFLIRSNQIGKRKVIISLLMPFERKILNNFLLVKLLLYSKR